MSERETHEDILSRIALERQNLTRIERIRSELIRYIRLQWIMNEEEEELRPESNNNPNFLKEKDMKFNLYPFYINWKKIEERKNSYYDIFIHFGYLGAAIFSTFKEDYAFITYKNIIFTFSSFCHDFLLKNKEKDNNELLDFMNKLPEIDKIYKLIKNKVLMYKEIPIFIIILKIYEIYYLFNVEEIKLIELLKHQYLLINYLKDEEYNHIFRDNFSGKVFKVFKKMKENMGKQMEFPKSKKKYLNHIKYIYQSLSKTSKEQATKKMQTENDN